MLELGAGATAAWITGTRLARQGLAAMKGEMIPLGLELWSVRQQCEKELPAVLRAVGENTNDDVLKADRVGF